MSYLLFSPGSTLPKTRLLDVPHGDKIIHFSMFGIFCLVWLNDSKSIAKKITYSVLVSAVVFAGLSEIIQGLFISGRTGNIYDFAADLLGLVLGLVLYSIILSKYHLYRKS